MEESIHEIKTNVAWDTDIMSHRNELASWAAN